MSLIITSSSQKEYDRSSAGVGITNPASFQNFFSSPLKIEKDSEIALVSIKCNRDDDQIVVDEGDGLFVYWGQENPDNEDDETGGYARPTKVDDIHTALRVELDAGTYVPESFVAMLRRRLEEVILPAFREVASLTVAETRNTAGEHEGYSIQFIQRGSGAAFSSKPSHTEFGAYIDDTTVKGVYNNTKYNTSYHTDNFIASASGTDVLITGHNPAVALYTDFCDVIGKAHPLSQVNSKCIIYFNGSSASDVEDGYTLGLIRSQGGSRNSTNENYVTAGGMYSQLKPEIGDGVNLPPGYEADASPPMLWDVAFNWVPGEDGQVIHLINNNSNDTGFIVQLKMETVTLANTPTNASLTAKYWDRVEFHMEGETVKVYLGVSASSTLTTLVDGSDTTFGNRVKPLGQTCNQLYPKIAIYNNDDTNPGTAWLSTWNGHPVDAYFDKPYFGYDSFLERQQDIPPKGGGDGGVFQFVYNALDKSTIYATGNSRAGTLYTYKGELSGHKGIANKWTLLTGNFQDIPTYFNYYQQRISLQDTDVVQSILGMPIIMDETDYGVSASGSNGADITFSSTTVTDTISKTSMFVRIKNKGLNSYNGNRRGISNIIYSCPRFDSLGNSAGLLFYEPAERVYVKLNNATRQMLNSLEIDIVDVNEKVIDSLVGNTLVVLHVREAK